MSSTDPKADRQASKAARDALGEPFDSEAEWHDSVKVIRLKGTLGSECSDRFRRDVCRDVSRTPTALILDLSGLTFIDSSGIRLLVETRAWALEDQIDLAFVRGTGQVQRALELAGIDREVRMGTDASELLGQAGR